MTRPTPRARILWLLFATLQFSLPGAVALADARLQAKARGNATTHVEAHTTSKCAPAHASDCALCRYLTGASARVEAPLPQRPGARRSILSVADACERAVVRGIALARAPPALLNG